MNIIYLIGFLVVAKLFHSAYMSNSESKKQTQCKSDDEEDQTDFKYSIETPEEIQEEIPIEKPKELGKNKWLYPTDEFGKMEKGREV